MLSVYLSSVVSLGIKPPVLMNTDIKKIFFFNIKKLLTQKAKKNADYIARRRSQNAFPYSNLLAARCFVVQWNFSFGTPLFKGHPHLGNTKFGPGKMFT